MPHLPILPILLPLMIGALLVLLRNGSIALRRASTGATLLTTLALALLLARETADGTVLAYLVGNWRAPFGIALAVDRLTVLMLILTSLAAIFCVVAAADGEDARAPHFHALLCFQVMGLNGAFLTADLFNLFVFFEVLLISSYALLLHAADGERVRAATHYVVVNLTGSALFLIAVSLLYGVTGTLNMADLAVKIALLPPADVTLAYSAAAMLLVVFALKAALLPLYFWLPGTYRAASPAVAALFAIMTKVGVYSIARVFTLFAAGSTAIGGPAPAFDAPTPWLLPLGLATLALAGCGALAARDLRALVAALVIGSAGTLLATLGLRSEAGSAATLYYLVHSTFAAAAAFLLVGLVRTARGPHEDRMEVGTPIARAAAVGCLYFLVALVLAGLPPMSGFVAKLGVLASAGSHLTTPWFWGVVLAAGLLSIVALARTGSVLFWRPLHEATSDEAHARPNQPLARAASATTRSIDAVSALPATTLALAFALVCGIAVVVAAAPLQRHFAATAADLHDPRAYVEAVLRAEPVRKHVLIAPNEESVP
jgi:multicomponent K+:H+ antiporter subunit D